MGRYIIERRRLPGLSGYGGLGDDAKKDELKRSKLASQVTQGVPGAAEALAQANAVKPAQQAWDAAAAAMRAAAEPGIQALPALARPAARDALEKQILARLGPRPTTPGIDINTPTVSSGGGGGGASFPLPSFDQITSAGGGMLLPALGLAAVVGFALLRKKS